MSWFLFAISAPFFWSITNHIDKYLLSKYVKGGGIGSLIIFSCLFSIFFLPVLYFLFPHKIFIDYGSILILLSVGIINTIGVLFYLYALKYESVSIVVPFLQLIPVVGYFLGFIILKETISFSELISCFLIVFGAILLSLDINQSKINVKSRVLFFMLLSTFFFALHGVLFKYVAVTQSFVSSIFWEYVGLLIVGAFLLLFIRSYRKEFFQLLRFNGLKIFCFNFFNESLVLLGNLLTAFALILAPVALVFSVATFQPVFVFVIELMLFSLYPKLIGLNHLKNISYKIFSITIIVIGGYLLSIS